MMDTRETVLTRALQGDTDALNELLRAYRPYVQVLVRAVHGSRLAAGLEDSDLVQDALLAASRSFASFRGQSIGEFLAWLRTVASRAAGHSLRQRKSGVVSLEEDDVISPAPCPHQRLEQLEQSAEIAAALEQLPSLMREVILARHLEELSHQEIAARMGSTPGAIRVLYMRALRRLREELTSKS